MAEVIVKKVKLSEIKLNPDNPRRISDADMERLVKSINDFPEMMSLREIVVDETMTVLGGNMRTLALRKTGAKECTAKIVKGLTEAQKREFVIKDNGSMGEWDFDLLANGWSDLPLDDWGVDLPEDWLNGDKSETTESDAEPQIDRAEELNKIWQVKSGDLWQIGEHRLLCGDSTKAEDVGRVMGGEKADMVFTDPPYGVSYAEKNTYLNAISRGNRIQTEIVGDHKTYKELADEIIYPAFCQIKEILADRSSYYITAPQGGDLLMMMMMMMMQKAGLVLRHMLIWVKNNHVLGRTDYNYKHEPILFGWVNVHDFYGKGEHHFSTWEIPKPLKSDLHPTMKPVELVVNALLNSTSDNGIMADLFGGSGTSMVACQNTKRKCRMSEITPDYCAVILQRMADAFPGIEIRRIK
ncbi:MAG: DNA methyltransferase [Smithella sp.]